MPGCPTPATYKRASLILRDPDRLQRILTDPRRPVQIVFAGKAHPADESGKQILRGLYLAATDSRYQGRIAFVEDYDMEVARRLVHGVDVWLNTPQPPLEASGTSGQKAALNGVPNLSVLDGWWCEAFDGGNGWVIGSNASNKAAGDRDPADADSLYRLLESAVVPLYYAHGGGDVPVEWVRLMKRVIRTISAQFNARRMMMWNACIHRVCSLREVLNDAWTDDCDDDHVGGGHGDGGVRSSPC